MEKGKGFTLYFSRLKPYNPICFLSFFAKKKNNIDNYDKKLNTDFIT